MSSLVSLTLGSPYNHSTAILIFRKGKLFKINAKLLMYKKFSHNKKKIKKKKIKKKN